MSISKSETAPEGGQPGTPSPGAGTASNASGNTGKPGSDPGASGVPASAVPVAGATRACPRDELQRPPYTPADPSPVQAQVYVKEDPGIHAPIDAVVGALPITVVVRFAQDVERNTFGLGIADTRCDYEPGPIYQDVLWLSDREAEIALRSLPYGKPGPYTVSFGGGRDRAGKEVQELRFLIGLQSDLRLRIYAVPVAGGGPSLLFDHRADLRARSVSPDGRYMLLERSLWARANTHSPVRIPYIADLQSGELRSYSPGDITGPRWDLSGQALWINGWQRLKLGGPGDTGRAFLDKLPSGGGSLLNAQVSPDGRWLAALRTPSHQDATGQSDFFLVNLDSDEVRSLPGAFGYLEAMEGPPRSALEWAPDSKSVLIDSYRRSVGNSYDGTSEPVVLDPLTLNTKLLEVPLPQQSRVLQVSPSGKYLSVSGVGIITRDGRVVIPGQALTGSWFGGERFLLIGNTEPAGYTFLEVTTGREFAVNIPWDLAGKASPLDLSPDGGTLYVARQFDR